MEYFIVSFFLIQFIRPELNTAIQFPKWDKKLLLVKYASVVLLSLYYIFSEPVWMLFLGFIFLVSLVWIIYKQEEFRSIRGLIQSLVPFIIIAVFKDLLELTFRTFYHRYASNFETAKYFALFFVFAMWLNYKKQQKVVVKERELQRKKEEAELAKRESLEYMVSARTAELTQQKEELQRTIEELKSTQNQLIQSEKMASLGELTAGIAHEIQNPLNFVNNFSEVSVELCQELEEEIEKTPMEESEKEYIRGIISDLSQNQQKITHHGRRADSIVKGMLQHSRTSTGEKEPTDINALADEYMRLAYHGLRAKDKEFNAALLTDFDTSIGKVPVMPQDLGRVFLNLFTNAFYAVAEKKRKFEAEGKAGDYKPSVKITTKKFDNTVYIRVEDNGTGMPESVKAKIFQPFFTTKPTGQGTGLGLSMSYDIVTNLHDGSLDVSTIPGEGTEFKISLPVSGKETEKTN